jgi:tellurite resistance protein
MSLINQLFEEYSKKRNLKLNKDQFVYLVNLFPALRVALSDGMVDDDEWVTVKRLAQILGDEFASDDTGKETEQNLMVIYKSEFSYLIKNIEEWEEKFLVALKAYFEENEPSKEFVMETMYLFANASDGVSDKELKNINQLTDRLGLDDIVL